MKIYKVRVITHERNNHNRTEKILPFETEKLAREFINSASSFDGITTTFAEPVNF